MKKYFLLRLLYRVDAVTKDDNGGSMHIEGLDKKDHDILNVKSLHGFIQILKLILIQLMRLVVK